MAIFCHRHPYIENTTILSGNDFDNNVTNLSSPSLWVLVFRVLINGVSVLYGLKVLLITQVLLIAPDSTVSLL